MAWSVLQSASAGPIAGGNVSKAYGTNLSSGTKLIAYTFTDNNSGTDVTGVNDGNGNNFTLVPSSGGASSFIPVCDIWVLDTPAGDVGTKPTITATAAAGNHTGLLIQEVSGLAAGASASFDGTPGTANGLNVTPTSASYSSTASNEFLVTSFADDFGSNPTWTIPSNGYTQDAASVQSAANTMGFAVAYKNSTNGAESATWTTSSNSLGWGTVLGAFKLAASAGPAGTVQPRATVPVPRRRPTRAIWARITGQAFVAVPAPVQQFRTAPRRKLARAYIQFIPVTTTNAAAAPGVVGTVPVLMANQTRIAVRRDGRVVRR